MRDALTHVDWQKTFAVDTPLPEIVLRGSVIYLALFLLLRFLTKRSVGAVGTPDLLVLVVIADAAQNAMAGEYRSISEGLALVGTIFFWNVLLDWLAYRYPLLRRWLKPPPLLLVREGHMLRENMRREFISDDEMASELRLQGVADVAAVKESYMESDGRISVIRREGSGSAGAPERQRT